MFHCWLKGWSADRGSMIYKSAFNRAKKEGGKHLDSRGKYVFLQVASDPLTTRCLLVTSFIIVLPDRPFLLMSSVPCANITNLESLWEHYYSWVLVLTSLWALHFVLTSLWALHLVLTSLWALHLVLTLLLVNSAYCANSITHELCTLC